MTIGRKDIGNHASTRRTGTSRARHVSFSRHFLVYLQEKVWSRAEFIILSESKHRKPSS